MKHFIYSKTFWAATVAAILEILTGLQSLPFLAEDWAHGVAVALIVFIAINRSLKNS